MTEYHDCLKTMPKRQMAISNTVRAFLHVEEMIRWLLQEWHINDRPQFARYWEVLVKISEISTAVFVNKTNGAKNFSACCFLSSRNMSPAYVLENCKTDDHV